MSVRCALHPGYLGERKPSVRWSSHPDLVSNVSCEQCWRIFLAKPAHRRKVVIYNDTIGGSSVSEAACQALERKCDFVIHNGSIYDCNTLKKVGSISGV